MRIARLGLIAPLVAAAMTLPAPVASAANRRPAVHTDFDSRNFDRDSTTIDNKWLPLVPGTQYVLEGTANRGAGQGVHTVIFTVTDVSKWVNNVRTLAVWDQDIQDGELVEEELALFAQDEAGNVWLMGAYPEEHDGDAIAAPSTWLAGQQDALAGIAMRAAPKVKTSTYLAGIAPAVEFLDKAKVSKAHQKTCVPVDCYKDVLVIDEWDPNQQPDDGHQFKFHAPGVGIVRVEGRGGIEQETLVLTKLGHLGSDQMAEARDRALFLDHRAYDLAKDVWRHTAFAHPLGDN